MKFLQSKYSARRTHVTPIIKGRGVLLLALSLALPQRLCTRKSIPGRSLAPCRIPPVRTFRMPP